MYYSKLFALVAVAVAVCITSACDYSMSKSSGSATTASASANSAGKKEITLMGETGNAELAGDKIRLTNGTVFVNGISFGPVPVGSKVKYTINSEGRFLFVNGQRRYALTVIN